MKRILATGTLALALVGATPVPASAHIERGVNCHVEEAVQLSGHRVHIEIRLSNRTDSSQRSGCQVKIVTTTHFRRDWKIVSLPARSFRVVRYTVRIPGDFRRFVITHGHVFS
jgi:hypothetical protein